VTCIVAGASAGLGSAIAEALAARRFDLVISASDGQDLQALGSDLRVRFGVAVAACAADARQPEALATALVASLPERAAVERLYFPLGAVRDDDDPLLEAATAEELLHANFLAVTSTVERFLPAMLHAGKGVIAGFGSVAAARGRSQNVFYAAAKGALRSYFESLRHYCEPRGVTVQFFVLGYLDTQMTHGRRLLLPRMSPRRAAEVAVHRERAGAVYLPRFWSPVTAVVRWLPWFLFKRMRF
jgi:short-subunit dehydrogenase